MNRTKFVFVLIIVVLHLAGVCHATDDVVECPGKDEAFVTTCSGNDSNKDSEATDAQEPSHDDPPSVIDSVDFDEDDIVNEVLEDSDSQNNDDFEQDEEVGVCDAIYSENTPIQQLKANFNTLTKRYYDPLPRNGKVAIGTSLGFIASRISLGVANRLFRVAGAIIVLSEMMYTSGFCDEAQCVPEEARPWIGILKRTIVNQCMKVRVWARKVYDQDKIRELAQKDEFVAGGFATGAFIGFVI